MTLGGLLGSSHCVGMCGGFAAMVGLNTGTAWRNLRSQLIYSAGRLTSYATLGAVAGFAGKRLSELAPAVANVPAVLCIVAGVVLLREGFLATGVWRRRVSGISSGACLLGPLFLTLFKIPGGRNVFVAGIATGLLPCGLVYAFVSLAGSTGDFLQGMLTMMAFGAGTVPLMVVTGCGASLLSWSARQQFWRIAAWSVVATGLLTLGRGIAFLRTDRDASPTCPFCAQRSIETDSSHSAFNHGYQ
jgi:sulfite exporter TauE/SafE